MLAAGQSVGFSRCEVEQLRVAISQRLGNASTLTLIQFSDLLGSTLPQLQQDAEKIFRALDDDNSGKTSTHICRLMSGLGEMSLQELFHGLWVLHHGSAREKVQLVFQVCSQLQWTVCVIRCHL